jgi:hypothetical protein
VATAEVNVKNEVSRSLEEARTTDLHEIEKLRSDLEQVHQSPQTSQTQISDSVTTSLSSVEYWYLEVEFSYIRVFSTSVPLYALLLFLPDKLLCREIVRQSVLGGIRKDLKGVSKKVWLPFPIRIGAYSLLDFGHAKAEAADSRRNEAGRH